MGLLERLTEIAKALFTTESELRHLRDTLAAIRQEIHGLADDVKDVRERVIRLETARAADRAQLEAELTRFKAEVERAVLRLGQGMPPAGEPPALPERNP